MSSPVSFLVRTALAITVVLLVSSLGSTPAAHAAPPFVVNTTVDAPDASPGDGYCAFSPDSCSLRAAIQEAYWEGSSSSPVSITFDAALAGKTIALNSGYGTIVWDGDYITVDGGALNITVSGASMSPGATLLQIRGRHNTLKNLTLRDAQWDAIQIGDLGRGGSGYGSSNTIDHVTIFHSNQTAIVINGDSSGGNKNSIQGSTIGRSNYTDTACPAGEENLVGILIYSMPGGGSDTVIGGSQPNAVVCNTLEGVSIRGVSGVYTTTVEGNYIGTGNSVAQGNGGAGIFNTGVGGAIIHNNTISGNKQAGVWVQNGGWVTIKGNRIGTNPAGTSAIPNAQDGVQFTDGTHDSVIGGTSPTDGNLISGNTQNGVLIDTGSHDNAVDNNYIGLKASGMAALPNGWTGIDILGSSNGNAIGGPYPGARQYISGNTNNGIGITNSMSNVVGIDNFIGVATDNATSLGNGIYGVDLYEAANNAVLADTIRFNNAAGVVVGGNTATGNMFDVRDNRDNGGLAIDLGGDGFTANGTVAGAGPNDWIHYPVITSASGSAITGTACNGCTVLVYRAVGNPATPSGGGIYVQSATADGSGHWTATLSSGLHASDVSLVACQSPCTFSGDTSEMSPRPVIDMPLVMR